MLLEGRKRAVCLHRTFTVDKIRQGSPQRSETEGETLVQGKTHYSSHEGVEIFLLY